MKRLVVLFTLALVSIPISASAKPLSGGCAYVGGCINLVDNRLPQDPLWVHTLQAGISGPNDNNTYCGYFKIGQKNPGGSLVTIHTSNYRCVVPAQGETGPTYTQDKDYLSGTEFCGWFSGYYYQNKGCVTVHS